MGTYDSLAPWIFKIILKIPYPTINFKGDEAKDFLKEISGGLELLREYIEDLGMIPEDLSSI
jgi:hypothetical protein